MNGSLLHRRLGVPGPVPGVPAHDGPPRPQLSLRGGEGAPTPAPVSVIIYVIFLYLLKKNPSLGSYDPKLGCFFFPSN